MSIRTKSCCFLFSLYLMFSIISCGVKSNPLPPERILVPTITDLNARVSGKSVILKWSPSFHYTDGEELFLRGVEIYRMDENLEQRLEEQKEREILRREASINAGNLPREDSNESAKGELNRRIEMLSRLPVIDFERNAELIGTIPIEQLIELATGGKIHWSENLNLQYEDLPTNQILYAIREVDIEGRRSPFSNFVRLYPIEVPSGPTEIIPSITQEKLTLYWNSPDRQDEKGYSAAMIGYNIYRSQGQEDFSLAPLSEIPIPTGAPLDWKSEEIISHQRVEGLTTRNAYLFATSGAAKPSGISQTLYSPGEISGEIGNTVEVELLLRSVGEQSEGRIILDASKDPDSTAAATGADIFREEDNPLIQIQDISITKESKTFRMIGKVPLGAIAYVLRIEPRCISPVSASFVLESVVVREAGNTENIVENGDFDGFTPVYYSSDITDFGPIYRFKVTSVYSIAGSVFESEPSDIKTVQILDTFPPDAPRGVRAQSTADSITITWSAVSATDLRGYEVYRRKTGDTVWRKISGEILRQTLYRDRDVRSGTTYEYKVEAVDRAGNSSDSTNTVTAEPLDRRRRRQER